MSELFYANNASTTLAVGLGPADTTISLATGTGALFPALTTGQYFVGSLVDAATGLLTEIVYATARTADSLTVVRGREGTAARNWLVGDTFANFWTAGQPTGFWQGQTYAGNPNGNLAGNAGVLGTVNGQVPSLIWDTTNATFWICSTSGDPTTAVWTPLITGLEAEWCGTSTGSANVQVVTPNGALTAVAAGLNVAFIAGYSNTSAMTLTIGSLGTFTVRKSTPSGSVALVSGDVTAGNVISAIFDGTRFQLISTALGTAAKANASSGTNVVAAVTGSVITGHMAVYSDTVGSLQDGGVATVAEAAIYISASTTLGPGIYDIDTSAGAVTITTILVPTLGNNYTFRDVKNSWGTNHLTVNGNGTGIGTSFAGAASTFVADVSDYEFSLSYVSTGPYWRLV